MIELGNGDLDPFGETRELGDIRVRAPGVSGSVTVYQSSPGESRAESLGSDALAKALEREDVAVDYVLEFSGTEEVDVGGVETRSTSSDHSGIEITVPAAGDGFGQVVLVTDENEVASWQLPVASADAAADTRAGDTVTFVVPGYAAESDADPGTRGVLGFLGKKLVRVLSFRIVDDIIGKVGDFFAGRWEAKKRPYAIRTLRPDNYRDPVQQPLDEAAWAKLADGPALLFVHGTFSRANTAFYLLPRDDMKALHDRYGGRVFAFDHMTLSKDPTENAAWFIDHLPPGADLTVDIVCHSRGGHVSRILAEAQDRLPMDGRNLNVRRVVFVASPNRGTRLAQPDYMGDFVDAQTNILSVLPDNVITDVLEVIVAVVKQLAVGAMKGLDGLQAMNPGGDYLKDTLNTGRSIGAAYYAIASDFEPTEKKWKPWAKDRLMDKVFREPNDLVVPSLGVHEANGGGMFPIDSERRLMLGHPEGVHHGSFFGHPLVIAKLHEWLPG